MGSGALVDLFRQALMVAAEVGAPFILAALAVGLVASLLQAATQLSEGALSFVPKIAAVGLVVALMGPWLLERLTTYTRATADAVVEVGRGRAP
jgi:flagellar biosynthetic protein FliQ